jgi:ribosomal protein L23
LRIHRKQRRRGRFEGYTALGKKAVVRLKDGDKIEILEGA